MEDRKTTISVSEFKATCLSLLARVKATGETILVTKRGEPLAVITPPPEPEPEISWLGSFRDSAEITGDVIEPTGSEDDWEVLT